MKKIFLVALIPLFFSFKLAGDAEVFIDGKKIEPEGTIVMEKDDTILFECHNLKPSSYVHFNIKKAGIKWKEDVYYVDETGSVKEILDIPDKKLGVTCVVDYYDADGDFNEVKFKFKVR